MLSHTVSTHAPDGVFRNVSVASSPSVPSSTEATWKSTPAQSQAQYPPAAARTPVARPITSVRKLTWFGVTPSGARNRLTRVEIGRLIKREIGPSVGLGHLDRSTRSAATTSDGVSTSCQADPVTSRAPASPREESSPTPSESDGLGPAVSSASKRVGVARKTPVSMASKRSSRLPIAVIRSPSNRTFVASSRSLTESLRSTARRRPSTSLA